MKMKQVFLVTSTLAMTTAFMTGCAAKMFEKELNVVFMHEGEVVDSGTVTQFKNYKSPTISKAYIPTDFKFLGWTCYSINQLDFRDAAHFKTQYIGDGRMVHYMDVKQFAKGDTVVCESLMLHKDDIPKEYHYAVVAWYDKEATSGLTASMIDSYEKNVKEYLLSEGVSQEDVNTILFRGYSGNVGPTTGQILYDDDVDIMLGWGSVDNISTTGSIPVEILKASDPLVIGGKNRYVHRLTDTDGSKKVYEYMLSEASTTFFA